MNQPQLLPPVKIAVTGAAGQIAYSLLFRLISGELLGPHQPIILQLAELPQALEKLKGVAMELEDTASPLLAGLTLTTDLTVAFKDADIAILIGAKPRGPGMERKDLLLENGRAFYEQGKALNAVANPAVKVLVVGNPANTNALSACQAARDIADSQFTALTRLDLNRLQYTIAHELSCNSQALKGLVIWGNHSSTMVPDISHATFNQRPVAEKIDTERFSSHILPTVQQRGAAIIKARGVSSAGSTAQAIIDHLSDWVHGTPKDGFTCMSVISTGQYGVRPGLCFSYPVHCQDGTWKVVEDLKIAPFYQTLFEKTEKELIEEESLVQSLIQH